ncbi:YopX family protein [Segatella buccae]|uniref:YopX family protein n=1 Tax=Segatella buccae TaxID=28126 RepID=UPI003FD82B9F
MNREIIFRGKSIGTGEWLYGHLFSWGLQPPSNVPCICACVPESWGEAYNLYTVHPATIGQYTGLTDKNENKIYEGDILRLTIPDGSVRHFVVEWANRNRLLMPLSGFNHDGNAIRISGWCFNWKGNRLYPSVIDGVPDNKRMQVVGNIHDTPDLLKG